MISTSGRSLQSRPVGASRSVMTTSAAINRLRPRTVMRSSAPGPPPTRTTTPVDDALASATAGYLPKRGDEPVGRLHVPYPPPHPPRPHAQAQPPPPPPQT